LTKEPALKARPIRIGALPARVCPFRQFPILLTWPALYAPSSPASGLIELIRNLPAEIKAQLG